MPATLSWDPKSTPPPLHEALRLLAEEYPIVEGGHAECRVTFSLNESLPGFKADRSADGATIEFARVCDALRGLGALLSDLAKPSTAHAEHSAFTSMGIMLDCSRNAVMTVQYFKRWLRRLALMGFNMAMLYTEDTYELPGEDCFGYLRGRYTADELREIDAYAHGLGIEMIGCVQTLGHLAQILKWHPYRAVQDTGSVMLVGEPKTYELIEKMMAQFASVFRSRRIHVGMDETHDLGRGQYLDLNGYKRPYDIFNEHLKRVVEICRKYALKPMIWSDMYFRMGSKTGDYYDKACVIPEEVKAAIPKQAELVYWDYYHDDEEFYLDWIARHRGLGFEPIMGSGVWTWGIPWYGPVMTEKNAGACVRACTKAGLKEIFFTLWGDDGGYCEFDSALAGLTYVSELAYTGQAEAAILGKRYQGICSASYAATIQAGELAIPGWTAGLMWDDPLLAIFYRKTKREDPKRWDVQAREVEQLAGKLAKCKDAGAANIAHAALLAKTLSAKMKLISAVHDAYARKDPAALKSLKGDIEAVIDLLRQLDESYRAQWLRRNKPFGLEVLQILFAGQIRRFQELAHRLEDFTSGQIGAIPEFEQPLPAQSVHVGTSYRALATASCIL